MVGDATIGFPAFELRATEAVAAVPPKDVALDSSIGTSNDGFRIERPALPIPINCLHIVKSM